ncbi:hypothetical protein ACWDV4_05765 [Micromonospora sp. NPDC003197]
MNAHLTCGVSKRRTLAAQTAVTELPAVCLSWLSAQAGAVD